MKLRSIVLSIVIGISVGTTVTQEPSFSQQLYQAPLDKPFFSKDFKDASWRYNLERVFFDVTLPWRYLLNIFNKEKLARIIAYNEANNAVNDLGREILPELIIQAAFGFIIIDSLRRKYLGQW
jgi:hypothetical protein